MWKEFREFISRGNVMDLAVGVIIGAAFGKIVSSLVDDILMPCTPERVWKAINGGDAGGADPTEESAMPHFVEGDLNQDQGETGEHQ